MSEMTCQDCERPFSEVIDFLVATPIWNYVMADERQTTYTIRPGLFDGETYPRVEGAGGVVCLACFDKRARELGVTYRESLVVFGIACWMGYDTVRMPLVHTWEERDWEPIIEVAEDVRNSDELVGNVVRARLASNQDKRPLS